ncbi:MAG: flavodoxin family protein [Anaerolineae bacterium]
MKVILVNGSPHPHGCTYTALAEVAGALNAEGIESEVFQLSKQPLSGCTACGHCGREGRCVFDDQVNEFVELARGADGFVFGSPVYYAGMAGGLKAFMDRAFYSDHDPRGSALRRKPAACVVSARRAGTTAALDQMQKYLTISEMPVVSSSYWPMVHGFTPDQVRQDLEGLQIMRTLGRNMAWLLKCIAAGAAAGVRMPEPEPRAVTNFIR